MLNIIKEYRHYLATVVLIIVPVIALNAGGKQPAELHWFDRATVALSRPIQTGIRWTIDTAWDGIESYLLLLKTQENNQSLALENRRLLNELSSFQEVARENERLRKMADFNQPLTGKKIIAQVIAQDVSPEFRMIRLNKGSDQGIKPGMAVISYEGIVGRIIRVGSNFSDTLALLDGSSAIDGLLQRNRVRGVVEGLGSSYMAMKYLRRTDDVQEGDVIISSGIGGLFPKGLSIGKVVSVKKKNYGISQTVEVSPSVDFNRLEEVTVIDPPKIPIDQTLLDPIEETEVVDTKESKTKQNKDKPSKSVKAEKNTEKKADKKENATNP